MTSGDALPLLVDALRRSALAGTVRLEGSVQPGPGDGPPALEMAFHGVADLRDQRALVTMQVVAEEVAEPQPPRVVLHDGRTIALQVDDGEWMEMPVGTGGVDPLGVLDLLGGAVIATETSSGAGPTGARELDVVLDVEEAIAGAIDPGSLARWTSEVELSGEVRAAVWIGTDGHVERAIVDLPPPQASPAEPVVTRIDVRYADHGAPVAIPERPESEPGDG